MESDAGLREAFGRVFFNHRSRLGISQEKFANSIGVHRSYIYLVEKGDQNPALETIFKLAKGLGVTPEELIAETRSRLEDTLR